MGFFKGSGEVKQTYVLVLVIISLSYRPKGERPINCNILIRGVIIDL